MLKLLEKRPAINKVEITVGVLPKCKKFSRLSDEVTKRRYVIGKITMVNGRKCVLIDVERENRAL